MGPHSARRRGFTLVELLVVIGIIAVLVAILLPSLAAARESAKASKCLSNMRQIAMAFAAYTIENRNRTPYQSNQCVNDFANPAIYDDGKLTDVSCLALLMRYIGRTTEIYACPVGTEVTWTSAQGPTQYSRTNYMANQATLGLPIARIRNSAEVVFLQEDRYLWQAAWLRPYQTAAATGATPAKYCDWCFDNAAPWGQEYSNLHKRGGNLAFVDGHAEWRAASDMHPSAFGLTGIPGTSNSNDPNTVPQAQTYYRAFN